MEQNIETTISPNDVEEIAKKVIQRLTHATYNTGTALFSKSTEFIFLNDQATAAIKNDIHRKFTSIKLTTSQATNYNSRKDDYITNIAGCASFEEWERINSGYIGATGLTKLYLGCLNFDWQMILNDINTEDRGRKLTITGRPDFTSVTTQKILEIIHNHYVGIIYNDFDALVKVWNELVSINNENTKVMRDERGVWGFFKSEGNTDTWQRAIINLQRDINVAYKSLSEPLQRQYADWLYDIKEYNPGRSNQILNSLFADEEKELAKLTFTSGGGTS